MLTWISDVPKSGRPGPIPYPQENVLERTESASRARKTVREITGAASAPETQGDCRGPSPVACTYWLRATGCFL
jgi:hypothetical protein